MSKGIYKKFQEYMKDHAVRCCAIDNKDKIYFGMEFSGDAEGGCAAFFYPQTERKWGAECKGGFYRANCCVLPNEDNSFILVGWKGDVMVQRGLKKHSKNPSDMIPDFEKEDPIPLLFNCPLSKMRLIDGQAYVVGAWRTVFKRDNENNWTCLSGNDAKQVEALQKNRKESKKNVGFKDIAGFSGNDIYACGDDADLWHYDGQTWQSLETPTDKNMVSICCSPAGLVYIVCEDGSLLEGRDHEWNILSAKAPNEIHDTLWYQGCLYIACGTHGIYQYNGSELTATEGITSLCGPIKDGILMSPQRLATNGEILLVSDVARVTAFNGEEWKMFFMSFPSKSGGELW